VRFRKVLRPAVAINIAPLVDVVFLLVIFFAVSTTFLETAGLKLELPTSSSTATREPREITILLASDGTLSYEGEIVERDALRGRLRGDLDETERKIVVLRADANTPHGEVVGVMDLIREAGAEGLTVAARTGGD
jgi:biopolymer transport protein ExbD/biopolymer transport protein TolR